MSELSDEGAAVQALAMGLLALIDELAEQGLVEREAVANRLRRLRKDDGSEITVIAQLAMQIEAGHFRDSDPPPRPTLHVV